VCFEKYSDLFKDFVRVTSASRCERTLEVFKAESASTRNYIMVNILLISDSHGKRMASILERKNDGWSVLTLRLGQKVSSIRGLYRRKLPTIRRFRPDGVIFLVGHNDLVMHPVHNLSPRFITAVFHTVLEFIVEIAANFPMVRILASSLLPRVVADRFGEVETGGYNRIARRFGERLRSAGNQRGAVFSATVNRRLWGRIARWEVLPGNHMIDGLHLNSAGREIMATGWMEALVFE
jgi:lysophospholipase L1-like esterase